MVEEAKLAEYEKKLEGNLFLAGANPGKIDAEVLETCTKANFVPDQEKNPNFWAWYSVAVLFEDAVVKTWAEEKKSEKGQKGPKGKPKKEEKKEEKDDDDFDPFAEETEDDKKAKEEAKQKKKEEKGKKKKEKKPEKSCVLLDVKGYESDQDLASLAKKIMKDIKMEGLVWNKEFKLEEVAFGIKKIVMGLCCEDEKVSVDEIIEIMQEKYPEEVQSVEIVSFNKI